MYVTILLCLAFLLNITFVKFIHKLACTYNAFIFIAIYKPLYDYRIIYLSTLLSIDNWTVLYFHCCHVLIL